MARAKEAIGTAVLAAAQRGNPAAQAALFRAHKDDIARQVQRMTGNASVVDDLVQEVFIAAFSAMAGFRQDSQLETWLYRITANKVRNYWDAERRRQRREQQVGTLPREPVVTPEEEATAVEHRERLYAALGRLPHKLREAFTARAIENLSLAESSERLGVPVSTVSYRTRQAEARLCELLDLSPEVVR